jgi:hypothetical protein
MARTGTGVSLARLERKDASLSIFSGLMACLCAAGAAYVGLWAILWMTLFTLFDTPLVPIGHSHWLGMQFDKSGYVVQACNEFNGYKTCKNTVASGGWMFTSLDQYVHHICIVIIYVAPLFIIAFALFQASKCFWRVMGKNYFGSNMVKNLRNFALSALLFTMWAPNTKWLDQEFSESFGALVSFLISLRMHGKDKVVVNYARTTFDFSKSANVVNGSELTSILAVIIALTLTVLTAVMAKAAAIAEDNASIV